jgi:restriction system protein
MTNRVSGDSLATGSGPNPLGGPIWGYGIGGGYGTGAYGSGAAPKIELMLQAVVALGEKTREGHIIEAVTIPWFQYVTAIRRDPRLMQQLDPRTWEEMLAGAYKAAGYRVTLTPRSGDKGVDVIATRDGLISIQIIDQMKAYGLGNLVPASDVRELLGALCMHPTASKAILTTTSDFAPGVYADQEIQRLMPTRLDLRPGPQLIEWMSQIQNNRGS